jgi:hypothetical protein
VTGEEDEIQDPNLGVPEPLPCEKDETEDEVKCQELVYKSDVVGVRHLFAAFSRGSGRHRK